MANPAPATRQARTGGASILRDVVIAAHAHHVARIGRPPRPIVDDYGLVQHLSNRLAALNKP